MWPIVLIVVYSVLIVGASLAGGLLPTLVRFTHARMQIMVSLVAGLMLGVSLFHMLPHAGAETRSLDQAMWWTMVGLLSMFFLIRTFHFHHHDTAEEPPSFSPPLQGGAGGGGRAAETQPLPRIAEHDCNHDYDHDEHAFPVQQHKLSWIGVALGLGVHTLIDGVALAASVEADALNSTGPAFLGGGTFLAILLHKPLDAMSITSLMAAGGWSVNWRQAINAGFALMCPLGAVLFDVGIGRFATSQHVLIGCALAFSAGVFLCISLGDLLPEVQFHSHDRFKLSAALLLGVALAYAIGFLEPQHRHDHPPRPAVQQSELLR